MDRVKKIIGILRKEYPRSRTALKHKSPFELLVATILSAQCTDERVNRITPDLFKKYKGVSAFSRAKQPGLEKEIRSAGFYRNKAKNIINSAKIIKHKFKGKVPSSMGELIKLPGVARKTANIVLFNGYGIIDGIAVDTHVRRLSQRLGFTKSHDPEEIEQDLMKIFSKRDWGNVSNLLISHGRNTCVARKPKCAECFLSEICPSSTAK